MDAFGIFQGGGAKGLAHVGALAACEQEGIHFKGVAGASAGAIVAALASAGLTSDEMFHPEFPRCDSRLFSRDHHKLFPDYWDRFYEFQKRVTGVLKSDAWPLSKSLKLHLHYFKFKYIAGLLGHHERNLGIFETRHIGDFINAQMLAKLEKNVLIQNQQNSRSDSNTEAKAKITFDDERLVFPIKIVATDVDNQRIVVFSKERTPQFSIAEAVEASIALPFVFQPKAIRADAIYGNHELRNFPGETVRLVDGGLLSNFPAWLFDEERVPGSKVPTLGFRLVAQPPEALAAPLFEFYKKLFWTTVAGEPALETRRVRDLFEVPIPVKIDTLDFACSIEGKKDTFQAGWIAARDFICGTVCRRDPDDMRESLESLVNKFKENAKISPDKIVRFNIALPTGDGNLRILYTANMKPHADDALEFWVGLHRRPEVVEADALGFDDPIPESQAQSEGACGRAWEFGQKIYCDLASIWDDSEDDDGEKHKWNMTKYQQGLVWRNGKSLYSVPIKNPKWQKSDGPDKELLGIFNIDSDEDLSSYLRDDTVLDWISATTIVIGTKLLTPKGIKPDDEPKFN